MAGGRSADARANRLYWDHRADEYQERHRSQLWGKPMSWGVWAAPESELGVLGDVVGRDMLELGCGGGQWSIFLARAGARPVGMDNARQQLLHARRLMAEAGVHVPLVHAAAEDLPFADEAFDVVFCDHGGLSFADPERTLPECARVLRPGGLLAFNMISPLLSLCWNEATDAIEPSLNVSYFSLGRVQDAEGLVEYQLSYGRWIELFGRCGLVVEALIELRPGQGATTTYDDLVPLEWARRWPAENIWRVRKGS